ncbi:VCBS repeat-containing protein [Bradyrhizobium sp. WSM1417]|uniref:FG-GAP repeat domain-containing protein n=1 Tax=Bradyrhizobium sp. WSM1417 TaxID=754500 RepID=UPI0004B45C0C|nr:VCBS repeat-containing protein [Bradyrhizobium sp. WSM1417]
MVSSLIPNVNGQTTWQISGSSVSSFTTVTNATVNKPEVSFSVTFTNSLPIDLIVTDLAYGAGATDAELKALFDPVIINNSGSDWSGFRIDLVDVDSATGGGIHPTWAHFHDSTLSGWLNPSTGVFPYSPNEGFDRTTHVQHTPPGGFSSLTGASELQLSGGVFQSGTSETWSHIGVHEWGASVSTANSFTIELTPIAANPADDYLASTATSGRLVVNGQAAAGNIEIAGDHDWFRVFLWSDQTYAINEQGTASGVGTLDDTLVTLRDSSGAVLTSNDDGGYGVESHLLFVPTKSGYYYVDGGAFSSHTGTYRVSVQEQADAFSLGHVWETGATSHDRVVGDFNGDGAIDTLQIGSNGLVKVGLSSEVGFGAYTQWATGATTSDQVADLNFDGRSDLLQIYNGSAYVALSNGANGFQPWKLATSGATSSDHLVELSSGDNVLAQNYNGNLYFAHPNGVGGFNAWKQVATGATASDQFADVNGDGYKDIVQYYNGKEYAGIYDAGAQNFGTWTQWASGTTSSDRLADFNGDGKADVVQVYNGNAYVALSDGAHFGNWSLWTPGAQSTDTVADFNGDGKADLLQNYNGKDYVALSNGSSFAYYDAWATQTSDQFQVADVTRDGLPDIIHYENSALKVYASIAASGSEHIL